MEYPEKRTVRWVDDETGEECGSCEYIRADLVPQWRTDVCNAPRDGTEILAWADGVVIVSYRHDDNDLYGNNYGKMWLDNSYDDFSCGLASVPYDPTHWMPLPNQPEDK